MDESSQIRELVDPSSLVAEYANEEVMVWI